jgi:hypothetical protein
MHAAERNNDFAGEKILILAADPNAHANRATPLEQKCGRDGIANDVKIVAAAHVGGEIANRGRGALQRPVAHRHGAIAVAKVGVHIGDEGNLPFLCESVHRLRQRRPIRWRRAPDRHRAILPMRRSVKIPIVFELAVIGKHAVPAPPAGAERFPLGVIVRRSAMGHHPHHRRAAADDAALGESNRRRIVRAPPVHFEIGPKIAVVVVRARIGIEHVGRLGAGRSIPPRFEKQHAGSGTRRQPVRQHATRRTAADNNDIEPSGH